MYVRGTVPQPTHVDRNESDLVAICQTIELLRRNLRFNDLILRF